MKVLFCTILEPTKSNGATIYTTRVHRALNSLVGLDVNVHMIQFYNTHDPPPKQNWFPGLLELQEKGVTFKVYSSRPKVGSFTRA